MLSSTATKAQAPASAATLFAKAAVVKKAAAKPVRAKAKRKA
jgi:hypothetical protein